MTKTRRGTGGRQAGRQNSGQRRTHVIVREIVEKIERPVPPPPRDLAEARKSGSERVRDASPRIIGGLIEKAESGDLAAAKYLFEMVGLYPVTEGNESKPEESLAYTLLQQMGLPPLEDEGAASGSSQALK